MKLFACPECGHTHEANSSIRASYCTICISEMICVEELENAHSDGTTD